MNKVEIDGLELEIDNEDQILNMGGPWIGDLSIHGNLISEKCVVDNFVYGASLNRCFL